MSVEWSPPDVSPQQYRHEPRDGVEKLVRKLEAVEREARDFRNNLLKAAGMRVEPDVVRFTGNVAIEGTLSLPQGIIDNEALANPLVQRTGFHQTTGFALPSAWTEYAAVEVTIPAGFTRLTFTAIGTIEARNDAGSTQYLLTTIHRAINGASLFQSSITRATVPDLYRATGFVPYMWGDETVAPGDVHRFSFQAWVGGATWSADPANYARLELVATFSR